MPSTSNTEEHNRADQLLYKIIHPSVYQIIHLSGIPYQDRIPYMGFTL